MGIDTQRKRITLNPPIDCMVIEKNKDLVAPFSADNTRRAVLVDPACFSEADEPNGYYIINDSGSANKVYFWLGEMSLADAKAKPQSCGLVVVPIGASLAVSAFGRASNLNIKKVNMQCDTDEIAAVYIHIVNY